MTSAAPSPNTRIKRAPAPNIATRCCAFSLARRSSSLCSFLNAGDGSGGSPSNSRSIFLSWLAQLSSTTDAPHGGISLILMTPNPWQGQRRDERRRRNQGTARQVVVGGPLLQDALARCRSHREGKGRSKRGEGETSEAAPGR